MTRKQHRDWRQQIHFAAVGCLSGLNEGCHSTANGTAPHQRKAHFWCAFKPLLLWMSSEALPCWDGNWFALTYCLCSYINLHGHQKMEINSFHFGEACYVMAAGGPVVCKDHYVSHRSHTPDTLEEELLNTTRMQHLPASLIAPVCFITAQHLGSI